MTQRQPRERDEKHLDFIRQLPCVVCGNNIETQAAHVRYSDGMIAKSNQGASQKPHDRYTVPLCNVHHALQHDYGTQRECWRLNNLAPVKIALELYTVS